MNNRRIYIIGTIVVLVCLLYIGRLFSLQVLSTEYRDIAEKISLRKQTIYPQRGLIFDRNNKLLVYNEPVYDLMVSVPIKLGGIDTTAFCDLFEITRSKFDSLLVSAKRNAYRGKSIFKKNIDKRMYARLQERLFEFKGFFFEIRQDRNYKFNSAAHLLGYLGEIGREQLLEQEEGYYEQGDFLGKKGVESFYEKQLRGLKGEKYFYVDKYGVAKGTYKDGLLDVEAVDGKNILLSIDIELQQYGEKLLDNKMGSVVAIEPGTGEVLALISSPFYNPSDFNIQNRAKHYYKAVQDPTKPIYNRAVSAPYPPGSTFKPIMALVGLGDGAINASTHFPCPGYYRLGNRIIRCHGHEYNTSLSTSIAKSCNTYYCYAFKSMMQLSKYQDTKEAYNSWRAYLESFGFGSTLGIDVNGERGGWLKTGEYYDQMHGKDRWNYARIISLAFGQGELGVTPLQMANAAAAIANRGFYYTPHVIKQFEGLDTIPSKYLVKHRTKVAPEYFDAVVEGMHAVTIRGTSAGSAIPGIEIGGKTGTVQNPHGKNHSAYMAFAPIDEPKIAIAVVVEESGYGATWAAPIAHLMIEKYLHADSTESARGYLRDRLMSADLIPAKYKVALDTLYNE